jgi:hypothetical protein
MRCCATTAWLRKPPEDRQQPRYHADTQLRHGHEPGRNFLQASEVTTMTRIVVLLAVLMSALMTAIPVQAAQLYRWVDDRGRVEWRDTPPPANAKKVEKRTVGGSTIETSTMPYSLQQAVRNFPVTLYVSNCGEGCDKARAHLTRRGVPFTQKNPQDDVDAYKKLTNGGMEVPLLFVGNDRLRGYETGAWDAALDSAGYSRQPAPGYTAPKPAAAPAPKPVAPPPPPPVPEGLEQAPPPAQ